MIKVAATGFALAAFMTPAFADEFWILQDSVTKDCIIVEGKPTTSSSAVVGNISFKTKEEAASSMKTMKECTR